MLSFSLDFSSIFDMVSTLVTGMFPIYIVPIGIALAFGILAYIVSAFRSVIRS